MGKYNYIAKNEGRDLILQTRINLILKTKFNYKKTPNRYSYYMDALLGIILI